MAQHIADNLAEVDDRDIDDLLKRLGFFDGMPDVVYHQMIDLRKAELCLNPVCELDIGQTWINEDNR